MALREARRAVGSAGDLRKTRTNIAVARVRRSRPGRLEEPMAGKGPPGERSHRSHERSGHWAARQPQGAPISIDPLPARGSRERAAAHAEARHLVDSLVGYRRMAKLVAGIPGKAQMVALVLLM